MSPSPHAGHLNEVVDLPSRRVPQDEHVSVIFMESMGRAPGRAMPVPSFKGLPLRARPRGEARRKRRHKGRAAMRAPMRPRALAPALVVLLVGAAVLAGCVQPPPQAMRAAAASGDVDALLAALRADPAP